MMFAQRRFHFLLKSAVDSLALALAFFLADWLAKVHARTATSPFPLESRELVLWFVLFGFWFWGARFTGLYDAFRVRSFALESIAFLKTALLQLLCLVVSLFFLKTVDINRYFALTYFTLLLGLAYAGKTIIHLLLVRRQRGGKGLMHLVIVGAGESGLRFARAVQDYLRPDYRIVGFLDQEAPAGLPFPYLGPLDKLDEILSSREIDEVVIALPRSSGDELDRLVAVCDNHPTSVRIIPDYLNFLGSRFSTMTFAGFPLISLRAHRLQEMHWQMIKRTFDLVFTLFLFLVLFSWLFPLIALAIRLTSPGPILFRQERWGRKNRKFTCLKFRTMVRESTDLDDEGNYNQARRDDPRVTRLGRFLRRTNLDELPQFVNVLRGEMSVVGPRPHPTPLNLESQENFRHYLLRHLVKPGITGWAQVQGLRGETRERWQMERRIASDIWYIENWTPWLDLRIVFQTIWGVLRGDPAAF